MSRMAVCLPFSRISDDGSSVALSSLVDSELSQESGSTVWGPGALSGKWLKAVGELGLELIENIVIRRRLSTIKKAFDDSPNLFMDASNSPEIVRQMELDLRELRSEEYSSSIRQSAISIFIDICTLRKRFNYIKGLWNFNPRIFVKPKDSTEENIMAQTYIALSQLCGPWYSLGIRRMALSVVHRIAELEALALGAFEKSSNIKKGRWKELEDSVVLSVNILRRRRLTM